MGHPLDDTRTTIGAGWLARPGLEPRPGCMCVLVEGVLSIMPFRFNRIVLCDTTAKKKKKTGMKEGMKEENVNPF